LLRHGGILLLSIVHRLLVELRSGLAIHAALLVVLV
jgi:hypothetical protein